MLEFAVFARLERNGIETDEAVAVLAKACAGKPLAAWRAWAYQEIAFPYRLPDFGAQAVLDWVGGWPKN